MADLPLMSVKDAAEYLSVSPMTIYRSIKDGTLPHIKIRRNIRISRDALDTFLMKPVHDKSRPAATTADRTVVIRL